MDSGTLQRPCEPTSVSCTSNSWSRARRATTAPSTFCFTRTSLTRIGASAWCVLAAITIDRQTIRVLTASVP
jgi:hypothetical protein